VRCVGCLGPVDEGRTLCPACSYAGTVYVGTCPTHGRMEVWPARPRNVQYCGEVKRERRGVLRRRERVTLCPLELVVSALPPAEMRLHRDIAENRSLTLDEARERLR